MRAVDNVTTLTRRRYDWPGLLFWAGTIAGIVYTVAAFLPVPYGPPGDPFGDLHAYWSADLSNLYGRAVGTRDAFLYSPAFAQATWPLTLLPFEAVGLVWIVGNLGLVLWLRAGPLLLLAPIADSVVVGSLSVVYAGSIVVGMRWGGAWALMALTKVTPAIGAAWYAFRGEWRAFWSAVGVTVGIVVVSALVAPGLWVEWVELLASNRSADTSMDLSYAIPLVVRLPVALAVVAWGARTDRAWVLPVAVVLAMPVLWINALGVLTAVPALRQRGRPDLVVAEHD